MPSLFDMNQIGSAQQPQGFMQRGLLNPLTHIGLGLMSASAPRASWDPGGAMPNYAQGLLGGIHSYQQAQEGQAKQQYMQEMMRVRQQQAQAQQQEAQRKLEQEQQQQQAQQAYLLTLPPEQRQQVGALLGMGTSPDKVVGLLNPKQDLPPEAKLGEWLVPGGTPEQQRAAVQQWKQSNAKAGAPNVNVWGDPYKPLTKGAQLASDLTYLQGQPPSPERDQAITGLQREISALGVGTEERRSSTRMEAVGDIADEFNKIADANPQDVGPIEGSITRAKVGDSVTGKLARSVSPTKESEAQLASMEAQMRALLGTALSGAAIPAAEWPTYQAQVPSVTDDANTRKGKAKTYKKMLEILKRIQDGDASPSDLAGAIGGTPAPAEKPAKVLTWGASP